jgi:hypothetical protein
MPWNRAAARRTCPRRWAIRCCWRANGAPKAACATGKKRKVPAISCAGWALAALSVFDILILLPLLLIVLFAAVVATYVFYILGSTGFHLMTGLFFGQNMLAPALVGVGMLCGAVAAIALIALLLGAGLRLLGRYVRMRYRFATPTDPNG